MPLSTSGQRQCVQQPLMILVIVIVVVSCVVATTVELAQTAEAAYGFASRPRSLGLV